MRTHDRRSRQLPTNHDHAALPAERPIIREYQVDSPSMSILLTGLGRSRDDPRKKLQIKRKGLNGSSISGVIRALSATERLLSSVDFPNPLATKI